MFFVPVCMVSVYLYHARIQKVLTEGVQLLNFDNNEFFFFFFFFFFFS